jgi:bacillithiol biosynthesis cysteine-adding enzyme BshC
MPFKKANIKLSETGVFSKLIIDYINNDEKLRKFYTYLPEPGSFTKVMEDRSQRHISRDLLADVILDQYNSRLQVSLSDFRATNSNIGLLRRKTTFTVCTGHQLCLFTGPLYFLYKIISTINLAESLKKKYPQNDFVPVYWMASEDHDFEEIKNIHLFGKTLSWENDTVKGAVGRLKTASMQRMLEELSGILGESENAKELIGLFDNAYLKHNNLADATRYLVHELFGEYGLVTIDPDDRRLKREFLEIIKDDISNQTNFSLVKQTITDLEEIGIKPQVNPREINVFRLNEDRVRIEKVSAEVLNLQPEDYSPNVVLRPLYQQMILPNIAYVGGPGELAYWLEYKAMFDHHNIVFPILMPRNFALLSDEKTNSQLKKLDLSITDIFKDRDQLVKTFIEKISGNNISLKEEEEKFNSLFAGIAGKAALLDPTLKGSVESEMQKVLASIKNIESKMLRSEKQKQETSINQIKKLKDKFFPEGNLQERYENFSPYYLKYGKQLISGLKEAFDPFTFEMLILELN